MQKSTDKAFRVEELHSSSNFSTTFLWNGFGTPPGTG
jgi:hypothetical protein